MKVPGLITLKFFRPANNAGLCMIALLMKILCHHYLEQWSIHSKYAIICKGGSSTAFSTMNPSSSLSYRHSPTRSSILLFPVPMVSVLPCLIGQRSVQRSTIPCCIPHYSQWAGSLYYTCHYKVWLSTYFHPLDRAAVVSEPFTTRSSRCICYVSVKPTFNVLLQRWWFDPPWQRYCSDCIWTLDGNDPSALLGGVGLGCHIAPSKRSHVAGRFHAVDATLRNLLRLSEWNSCTEEAWNAVKKWNRIFPALKNRLEHVELDIMTRFLKWSIPGLSGYLKTIVLAYAKNHLM